MRISSPGFIGPRRLVSGETEMKKKEGRITIFETLVRLEVLTAIV
jgi:hypothetical protein